MRYLNKDDFVLQANIPSLESPVATYTCPQSQLVEVLGGLPFLLSITAYQAQVVANPTAPFTVTTSYPIQVPVDQYGNQLLAITAIAYDLTLATAAPVIPTSVSGNVITFPAIAGSAASDNIGVWYRLGTGQWTMYVASGKTIKKNYMIRSGGIQTLNAIDQYNNKTLLTLAQNYPIAPGDQLILTVNTPATVQLGTTSIVPSTNFSYDLNVAASMRFPVNITNQPS